MSEVLPALVQIAVLVLTYALSVLGSSLVGVLVLHAFGRLQQHLPLSLGFPAG